MNRSELSKRLVRAFPIIAGSAFVLATLLTAGWLYSGAPGLQRAPGWFYQWVNKGSFDMLLVAASSTLLPTLVRTSFRWARRPFWHAAGCIVVGSLLLQLATGILARHDVKGWTERFYVGHGEFTERAKVVTDAMGVLRNYERLAAQNQLGMFGPSKPPGTYAVYFIIDRTSRWTPLQWLLTPLSVVVKRDPGVLPQDLMLVTWTILVLGMCAALTALPLCWLGRTLLSDWAEDERTWLYPAWLFVTAPAINVISVHLDSTLFPLLSATCLALCVWSVRVERAWPAALGGVVGMLAVYCSYGNAPLFGLAGAVTLAMAWQTHGSLRASGRQVVAMAAGAFAVLALLIWTLNWQPLLGYVRGLHYHQMWRPWLPRSWRYLAFLEFSLFAGPPLMLAFLTSIPRSITALRRERPAHGVLIMTLVAAAVMLTISLWLGTPEAARLWLFMLPSIVCAVGVLFARPASRPLFNLLLGGQVVLVFFVKNYLVW